MAAYSIKWLRPRQTRNVCDRLRTLHMAALARHRPYIQLTSSAPFQSSPGMVSPREGNKVGRDSTDGSVFAPSGIYFALVTLIVETSGGAMERHVTKIHRTGR